MTSCLIVPIVSGDRKAGSHFVTPVLAAAVLSRASTTGRILAHTDNLVPELWKKLRLPVNQTDPLYQAACRVCGAEQNFLRVPCPECGATITVEDMGGADCPNEDFTTEIEWLVKKYRPYEDPKEDTKIAYCSNCERPGTPTAIPFAHFNYLCLSCLAVHDYADRCEWCGLLNASLAEYSYLDGCAMCSGKFGSESFRRE